eukprot:m.79246 g.79246  ORF g.79246 m.79246 type:complete len:513 (+) comp8177_c2_seq1:196-1734(+)
MALPQDDDVVQGQLMKWTNYIHGWQPRWFVFANGVLSYYLSQEEVELGCRGSFKAAAIDINVRQDEPHKFDLIIPNEQELFLEASDAKELQRWIVALQTAKLAQKNIDSSASSNSANSGPQPTSAGLRHIKDIRRQLLHQVTSIQARIQNIQETPINELKKELGSKLKRDTAKANELCVALARAVRELHVAAPASGGGMAPSDIESDTEERFRPETPSRRQFPTGLLPSPAPRHASNTSAPSPPPWELDSPAKLPVMVGNAAAPSNEPARPASPPDQFEDATSEPSTPQAARRTGLAPLALDTPNTPKRNAADRTFFSQMEHKFGDVTIHGDDGIDTREFLEACRCIVPFLNSVGSTTFAPVKSDINGNISKLQGHFDANPVRFNSLQSLVLSEIDANTVAASGSATDALVWLKRALEFINILLSEVVMGAETIVAAATTAYEQTLKQHHNWVVRGIFSVALGSVPYRHDFLRSLGPAEEEIVIGDMAEFSRSLKAHLTKLNAFYQSHNLAI